MAADDVVSLSDRTNVGMPIRNLIGLIGTICVGAWGYFGILERLNKVETNYILMTADVVKNSTFSRDWPLGKAGSLPQDSEQYMLIESLSRMIEDQTAKHESLVQNGSPLDKQQALTLDFYKQRIEALERKVEVLKDRVAQMKFSNGATH
tara:strand:+ start:403 stop:852 length:450 start_codon:yes stop_codon:yes gene_type:complete